MALLQSQQVASFIVRSAVGPAAMQDRQYTQDLFPLRSVTGADPSVLLERSGVWEALSALTKGHQAPRRERWASARQRAEELVVVGGLMFLRRPAVDQESMTLPAPAAPPASEVEPLKSAPKRPAADGPDQEENDTEGRAPALDAGVAASASATASASAAPPDAAVAPALDAGSSMPSQYLEPEDAGTEGEAPDAGWQKPAWAIPDNEIPVRRGPGQEDEKIILAP